LLNCKRHLSTDSWCRPSGGRDHSGGTSCGSAGARRRLGFDCTASSAEENENDSASVTCSNDKPDKGGTLLKAGTRQRQQLVAVQPNGTGTLFRLIYLFAGGS
jgi:hypothetical protein